jgi:hypothetical protein
MLGVQGRERHPSNVVEPFDIVLVDEHESVIAADFDPVCTLPEYVDRVTRTQMVPDTGEHDDSLPSAD